jgi:phage terminase large subunit-like protein
MTRTIPQPPTNIAGYDPLRTAGDCTWDGVEAARAVDFFPSMLRHVEGKLAGKPFLLEPWQSEYIATLFGWKRPDGTRRYRESLGAIPRKNGKTTLAAGIALYCLVCDNEAGAQVYSAAYSRDQASLVFSPAAKMANASPLLSKRLKVIDSTKRITYQATGSFYRAIPAEAANSHGFNAHCVVFDELHTQRDRDLYDVLKSSMGARRQPLFVSITTAGYDRHSICFEVWNHARQIRDGILDNPYFLPLIYEMTEEEDWQDEATWARVNPNLGVSISWEFLREQAQNAKDSPAYENTFRNLYCNQWVEQAVRWLSMEKWRLGNEEVPDLSGRECWGGLDLSTTTDVSALVLAFPRDEGGFYLVPHFWIPKENARQRAHRDGVPYQIWAQKGLIHLTDGDVVDFDVIRRDINELRERYNIQEIAIDRWNAAQLTTQLTGDGVVVCPFGQGYASMSPAAKQFEKHVIEGTLQHSGNEVLAWMAANVAIERDAAGNIKPSKKVSTERIDGIVAAVMAVGRAATAERTEYWKPSDGILL